MGVLSGYKYLKPSGTATATTTGVDVIMFKPSGLEGGIMGVLPYFYSGGYVLPWDGR